MKQRDLFGTAAAPLHEIAGLSGNYCRKAKRSNYRIDRAVHPGLVLYADGACEPNPGAGGWGFVVYENDVEVHFDCGGADPTTNNVMELTGALRALEWYAEFGTKPSGVRLFCDSMYVVNGCNDWRHGWKARGWRRKGKNPEIANLDLWKELDAALTAVPIQLEWCKGHVGIIGNERADELPLEGRASILSLEGYSADDLICEQLDYSARFA
jgi:ribonuclease HI